MADAHETKARIKEIRSRVFQEPLKEKLEKNSVNDILEQDLGEKKILELPTKEVKLNYIKNEDFINFKNELTNHIKDYFNSLEEKLNKTLNNFEVQIPDIKKGSSVREQLDDEIGDIISQRMIQQSRTLNRSIEDLSDRYASINDLSELKKGLVKVFEQETAAKFKNVLIKNKQDLEMGLVENSDQLEEFNSSIREDLSSLTVDFTSSKSEIDTKLKQNDEKITLLSSDVRNRIAKTTLNFASKNSVLEENVFQKVEFQFEESSNKLNQLEGLITNSAISSSKASAALKQDLETRLEESLYNLEGFNSSIREDFSSLLQQVEQNFKEINTKFNNLEGSVTNSIINSSKASEALKKDIDTRLEEGLDKLEAFNSFIREDHSLFVGGFTSSIDDINTKLHQTDEKINLLGSDLRNRIAKTSLDFSSKSNILEDTLFQKITCAVEENISRLSDFKAVVTDSIINSFKASDCIRKDLEVGLKDSLDNLEGFRSSVREDLNSLEGTCTSSIVAMDRKIIQNDEKISLVSSDIKNKISEAALHFDYKNRIFEETLLQKIENGSNESKDKFKDLEVILSNSLMSSFEASDAIKIDLEAGLKDSLDKLEGFRRSIREDFESLADSVTSLSEEKDAELKQNDEKMGLFGSNMQNKISEITLAFENKNILLEKSLIEKLKYGLDENVKKLEASLSHSIISSTEVSEAVKKDFEIGLVGNLDQLEGMKCSIQKDFDSLVSSFTASNEEIDLRLKQNDEKINLYGFDMRNGIAKISLDFAKKNSVSEKVSFREFEKVSSKLSLVEDKIEKNLHEIRLAVKDNLDLFKNLKNDVTGLRVSVVEESDALSVELSALVKDCQVKISQKIGMPQVESFFYQKIDEKLEVFSSGFGDRFETIDRSIQLVESLIVSEDDLTALFQNYTLNLNITRDKNVEKKA